MFQLNTNVMDVRPISQNNTSFSARNPKIRFADDIARRVNKSFPRISSTLLETHKFAKRKRFKELIWNVSDQVTVMRNEKKDRIICAKKLVDYVKAYIQPIKKYHAGNCGESAELAAIIAQANGLKNVEKVYLVTERGKDMDHAVLLVNDVKTPYIIDAWLGFADTIPNAVVRYKGEFRHCFDGRMIKSKKLKFIPSDGKFDFIINRIFTNREIKYLLKTHKDIILQEKNISQKT
ncbi:MAG: hypothetical protein E7Z87_05445 [Cyanobacteria bacterium SIG26]|nr:hypothetical protein [Cyanobacteria bacterium SIG26]